MGAVAGLFAGVVGSLAGVFGVWVTKKTAFGVAAVAVFSALTVALMAAVTAAINLTLDVVPLPDMVIFGFWYFMPSNFAACVSAIIAADVAAALYAWNVEHLRLIAYVS